MEAPTNNFGQQASHGETREIAGPLLPGVRPRSRDLRVQRWTSGGMPTSEGIPIAIDRKLATRQAKLAVGQVSRQQKWSSVAELSRILPSKRNIRPGARFIC